MEYDLFNPSRYGYDGRVRLTDYPASEKQQWPEEQRRLMEDEILQLATTRMVHAPENMDDPIRLKTWNAVTLLESGHRDGVLGHELAMAAMYVRHGDKSRGEMEPWADEYAAARGHGQALLRYLEAFLTRTEGHPWYQGTANRIILLDAWLRQHGSRTVGERQKDNSHER